VRKTFIQALQQHDLAALEATPKSDLHNHAGRGGSQQYIAEQAQVVITPPDRPFESLSQMQQWFEQHIKTHCPGPPGYLLRLSASFVQAQKDHIAVLALSFGLDEVQALGGMSSFVRTIEQLHQQYAPTSIFLPELAIGREARIDRVLDQLDEVLAWKWFCSIDVCNDELAQPIRNFKPIYRKAQEAGLRLKAHVGEFGSADDVMEAVEELELHEVHHGIAAAQSQTVMNWLACHRIQLNVCPTSNILLKRTDNYASHPIRQLVDQGIPVTVNTDDLLIFNQSVSQEYLNLYRAGRMTAEELDAIRETGLQQISQHQHKENSAGDW